MKFAYYKTKRCTVSSCQKVIQNNELDYLRVIQNRFGKDKFYCSHECLRNGYSSLGYDGAIHKVHQTFGPNHPVTIQIKQMRAELANFRKDTDYHDRVGRGYNYEEKNHLKLCHDSEKCL